MLSIVTNVATRVRRRVSTRACLARTVGSGAIGAGPQEQDARNHDDRSEGAHLLDLSIAASQLLSLLNETQRHRCVDAAATRGWQVSA